MAAAGERAADLERIAAALAAAETVLERFTPGEIEARRKAGGSPVTEADEALDEVLRRTLPRDGEGWLSEETRDDPSRLAAHRVWIVDPLDGTREFVEGLPEWCVSIGLVEDGRAVAGGIVNPAAGLSVLGAVGSGVTVNGEPATLSSRPSLAGGHVLASRSEVRRGEWEAFEGAGFTIEAMGSVAYKLARVAAGLAEATWTLVPKNEWDLAGGVALLLAAGAVVQRPDGGEALFNRADTLYPGLVACTPQVAPEVERVIAERGGGAGR